MRLLFIVFTFPVLAFGQNSFNGTIINKKTREKVPFATIGLIKENIGTNADEEGNFSLHRYKKIPNDSIIISCIGYETLTLPVEKINFQFLNIELSEKIKSLSEVVIKSTTVSTTLNDFKKCGNSYITTSGLITQLAQHFNSPVENASLTHVTICRNSHFYDAEKTIFRIRIYNMDSVSKAPSADLCNEIIEVKTKSKIIKVNLEKYNIQIPDKDFFIAVEWLKIPYNIEKGKMKINGKEVEHITYHPSIGWSDAKNDQIEAWSLDYKNNWRLVYFPSAKTSLSIAATIKY